MALHKITPNGQINVLNKDELREALDKQTIDWFQEQARGLTTARFDGQGLISAGAVTIPAVGSPNRMGPKMGFAWTVQRISVFGLATNDSLNIYRGSITPHNFIGTITAASPEFHVGSKGLILRADENLVLTGSSLSATGDIVVNGEAIEVPETDLFKLL